MIYIYIFYRFLIIYIHIYIYICIFLKHVRIEFRQANAIRVVLDLGFQSTLTLQAWAELLRFRCCSATAISIHVHRTTRILLLAYRANEPTISTNRAVETILYSDHLEQTRVKSSARCFETSVNIYIYI